jgi:hypothetical protein
MVMRRMASIGIIARVAAALPVFASAALAQPAPQQTPKNWTYDVDKHGNRVARNTRQTRPDGSWREEIRQGNCVTIKERSATGEYKETRQCNPDAPK